MRDNRDFILEYKLGGERTATGLMLYRAPNEPNAENFFLALVEPPKQVAPVQINPRDYIFVVDISGSMHGYPLDTAKVLLRNLISGLRPSDSFNVVLFSGSSRVLSEQSVPATQANIARAIKTIDQMGGGGSTEIVPALRRVAALPKPADVSRSVIVVTDGYVSVENEVFQLVRRNLDSANVFAFGIGSSVNRHLIEGLARAGQGEAFIVTKPERAAEQAERLRRMIDSPVLTQLKARFTGLEVYDVEPASLPDVMAGRPVVVWGKWRGDPQGAKLILQGHAAGGSAHRRGRRAGARRRRGGAQAPVGAPAHRATRRRRGADGRAVATRADHRARLEVRPAHAATPASSPSTRWCARSKPAVPVNQPLPLPQGVSKLAVGGGAHRRWARWCRARRSRGWCLR